MMKRASGSKVTRNKSDHRNPRRAFRRLEQLESRRLLAGDMTNVDNPLDVNNDAEVTARDALAIINYLNSEQAGDAEQESLFSSDGSGIYPDTGDDGSVSASDALRVINALAADVAQVGEGEMVSEVPRQADAKGMIPDTVKVKTGSNPRITFSGRDSLITITSPSSRQLRFEGDGLDETISIRYDLHLDVTGRGNKFLFDGANIPDDLFVKFTGTMNSIVFDGASIGDDFIFHGSRGADVVAFSGETEVEDDVIIHTKRGHDQVLVADSSVGDDFIYHANYGQDILAADNASVGDDAIVRMGDNNDTVSVVNSRVRDVADIRGGNRNDTAAGDPDTLAARRAIIKEFEWVGEPLDVQGLIDEVCAEFGQMEEDDDDNGDEYENGDIRAV